MSPALLILLALGIAVVLAAVVFLLGLASAAGEGDPTRERLRAYAALPDLTARRSGSRRQAQLIRLRLRLNTLLSALTSEEMSLQLLSANWLVTVTEYFLIRFGAALAGLLLGWALAGSPLSGVALAVVAYLVPGILLKRAIHRRQLAFEKQLVDVLVLINGAVRSGFSLLQAMEVVEREMAPPVNEEFRRVQREVALGLPLSQALLNLTNRMQNDDLKLMVTAININHQVGGNLATMLVAVTETIRERLQLFSEVRVITTQQRYTSYLISLLPFFVGALLFLMNPDYMARLFEPGVICIPIGAFIGILLGHLVISRMIKIEV